MPFSSCLGRATQAKLRYHCRVVQLAMPLRAPYNCLSMRLAPSSKTFKACRFRCTRSRWSLSMSRQHHEPFLASCGVFGFWGVRIGRPEDAAERTFTTPYAFIGARAGSCLRLVDPQVSRRHAYLQVLPGGLFCVDLSSRTGVRWGNEHQPAGWVGRQEGVWVGSYELALSKPDPDDWPGTATPPATNPLTERGSGTEWLPPFVVEVAEDGKVMAKGRMNRTLALVGRSADCLFHINSGELSKFHCSLVRTPAGLWVVDLLSRNGTFLNGRRIRFGKIEVGDRVGAGRYSLRFRQSRRGAKVSTEPTASQPVSPTSVAVPSGEPSTALEPARAGSAPANPVARRAAPTMLASPQNQLGPEWSMLIALVNQFSLMQQQMFDQFQENVQMTTRMFSSLQKDQMGLVRQELDELRNLTAELRHLQGELGAQPAKANAAPPVDALSHNGTPAGTAPDPNPAPPKRYASTATPGPAADRAGDAPPPARSPEELHAWLSQRISALQEDRQNRWNKLLGMLLGS
jgi:pSer/pThr/pTyr-binding forkhead associated (FHA) protein